MAFSSGQRSSSNRLVDRKKEKTERKEGEKKVCWKMKPAKTTSFILVTKRALYVHFYILPGASG